MVKFNIYIWRVVYFLITFLFVSMGGGLMLLALSSSVLFSIITAIIVILTIIFILILFYRGNKSFICALDRAVIPLFIFESILGIYFLIAMSRI